MNGKREEQRCPSCGSTAINADTELAPAVCEECGLVIGEELDTESFDPDGIQTGEQELHQTDEDKNQLINWQEEVVISDASDRQLVEILTKMDSIADNLLIGSSIRIQAAEFLTRAWELNVMHGRTQEITIGACLIAACQEENSPRPLRIVAEAIDVPSSKLFNTYRTVASELELLSSSTNPVDYLPYLQKTTKVSDDVVAEAKRFLNESSEIGGDPAGIAVAALYLAAKDTDLRITYVQAGEITGMTKETIWKKAKKIREDSPSINSDQV